MASDPYISHGRGGAANIVKDPTIYTDAGITREGPVGDQGDGPYSSGRGGGGNIGGASPAIRPTDATRRQGTDTPDNDFVPEQNVREAPDNYHVGRGGEGNAHHADTTKGDKVHVHEGAAERLKQKLFGKEGKP